MSIKHASIWRGTTYWKSPNAKCMFDCQRLCNSNSITTNTIVIGDVDQMASRLVSLRLGGVTTSGTSGWLDRHAADYLKEHSQACVERLRDVARMMGEVVGMTVKPGKWQCDTDNMTQTQCSTNNSKATQRKERIKWHIVVPPGLRQQSITVW